MRHHNFNFALDMEEKYIKYLSWRFDEFMASDQVPHYLELFPELKTRLMKFGIGILLWNMKGLIDIDNPDDVNKVRSILRILARPWVMISLTMYSMKLIPIQYVE